MNENEFLGWILDVAARGGWRAWHVPMPVRPIPGGKFVAERRAKGLPDLLLLHDDPPRLIFAEVKGPDGKLSDEQREFLQLASGVSQTIRSLFRLLNEMANAAAEVIKVAEGTEIAVAVPSERMMPVAVYSWRPGNEALIETVLVGRATS